MCGCDVCPPQSKLLPAGCGDATTLKNPHNAVGHYIFDHIKIYYVDEDILITLHDPPTG